MLQAIDYWTTILDQATTLQNDVDILLDCSITAANYNQTKEDLCTDILYLHTPTCLQKHNIYRN